MTARTKAQAYFDNFITYYDFPFKIHSDKGGSFEAKVIQEHCEITGMKKKNLGHHPTIRCHIDLRKVHKNTFWHAWNFTWVIQ